VSDIDIHVKKLIHTGLYIGNLNDMCAAEILAVGTMKDLDKLFKVKEVDGIKVNVRFKDDLIE
jgi:hypothetical protein